MKFEIARPFSYQVGRMGVFAEIFGPELAAKFVAIQSDEVDRLTMEVRSQQLLSISAASEVDTLSLLAELPQLGRPFSPLKLVLLYQR